MREEIGAPTPSAHRCPKLPQEADNERQPDLRLLRLRLGARPESQPGDDLAGVIADALSSTGTELKHGDVVVASKVVSIAEQRYVELAGVTLGPEALDLSAKTGQPAAIAELIVGASNDYFLATSKGFIIACAAGPASDVGVLIDQAHQRGWSVQAIATPAALAFIDTDTLEKQTGRPVRSAHRKPGSPRSPKADAIIIAPASFNTINKLAHGIADTYALDVAHEAIGLGIPVAILPFVNAAYAARAPFRHSVQALGDEGVPVLLGPGAFEPHPAGQGGDTYERFPWHLALDTVEARLTPSHEGDTQHRGGP